MTTTALYLNDNGRITCAKHAGNELAESIRHKPFARYHHTTLGTWERFSATEVRDECLDCDRCAHDNR